MLTGLEWPVESQKRAESADVDGPTQTRRVCGVCALPWTTEVISWSGNEVTGRMVENGSSIIHFTVISFLAI